MGSTQLTLAAPYSNQVGTVKGGRTLHTATAAAAVVVGVTFSDVWQCK